MIKSFWWNHKTCLPLEIPEGDKTLVEPSIWKDTWKVFTEKHLNQRLNPLRHNFTSMKFELSRLLGPPSCGCYSCVKHWCTHVCAWGRAWREDVKWDKFVLVRWYLYIFSPKAPKAACLIVKLSLPLSWIGAPQKRLPSLFLIYAFCI